MENDEKITREELVGVIEGNIGVGNSLAAENKFGATRGHGYAAENVNHLHDKLANADFFGQNKVQLVGEEIDPNTGHILKNGADRIVNGTYIQTKFCKTGSKCISECFKDGKWRYINADGTPMVIEVPNDESIYNGAVAAMKKKIQDGEIPGVTDPNDAEKLVRRSPFTYKQVQNIAKAGTIESITYDSVNGAITATYAGGITVAVSFAIAIWNGEDIDVALKTASHEGLKVAGQTFVTAVIAGQLSKAGLNSALVAGSEALVKMSPKATRFLANAFRKGHNIYGAAATKSAAKMLRGNVITGVASVIVLSAGDVVNSFRGRVSGKQLFKNVTETASSVVGGTLGWAGGTSAGAAIGTAVCPVIGTAIGGAVGAIAGSIAGGAASGKVASTILDNFIEDDADEMLRIIEKVFQKLAIDYLLSKDEVEDVSDLLKDEITPSRLKDMFSDSDHEEYAEKLIEANINKVIKKRKVVELPSEEELKCGLEKVLEELADLSESEVELSEAVQLEELVIDELIKINSDEIKIIENKILKFSAAIENEGKLYLNNCEVKITGKDANRIVLKNGSSLHIVNSRFVQEGQCDGSFIVVDDDSVAENITINNCRFDDCAGFIASGRNEFSSYQNGAKVSSFIMQESSMFNSGKKFVCIQMYDGGRSVIKRTKLIQAKLKDFNMPKNRFDYDYIFDIDCSSNLVDDVYVLEKDGFRNSIFEFLRRNDEYMDSNQVDNLLGCFDLHSNGIVVNSTFECVSKCIASQRIERSKFINCANCCKLSSYDSNIVECCEFFCCGSRYTNNYLLEAGSYTDVRECRFIDCYGGCVTSLSDRTRIKDSYFLNCENREMQGSGLPINIIQMAGKGSEVVNCIFDGINAKEGFVIEGNAALSHDNTIISVINCKFMNSYSKRESKKLVREWATYFGMFNKAKDAHVVFVDSESVGWEEATLHNYQKIDITRYEKDDEIIGSILCSEDLFSELPEEITESEDSNESMSKGSANDFSGLDNIVTVTADSIEINLRVEGEGQAINTDDVKAKVIAIVGEKVKELNIYVKPEEGMIYYTADGECGHVTMEEDQVFAGDIDIDLF